MYIDIIKEVVHCGRSNLLKVKYKYIFFDVRRDFYVLGISLEGV